MTKYKTKDGMDVVIPNIGVTVDGIIETDQIIESPIMETIDESASVAAPAAAPVEPQAVITPVAVASIEPKEQI